MGFSANEKALLGHPTEGEYDHEYRRRDRALAESRKIGKWTVIGLVVNRSVGSGIFFLPNQILAGTGCVGGALIIWVLAALIQVCGLYVWLECGLSMPQKTVAGEVEPRGVPRSGGEKNYLEFMFESRKAETPTGHLPHFKTTCSFAVLFILMYNLTGNAISLAIKFLIMVGNYDPLSAVPPGRGPVVGVAIGALTLAVIVHIFSRRGGIYINNAFAVFKLLLLATIIVLGWAKAGGAFSGAGDVPRKNFTEGPFSTNRKDIASWTTSLQLCMYTLNGYKQPFYVLGETKGPRTLMPKYCTIAMWLVGSLFVLVNISYLLVVPKDLVIPLGVNDIPESIDMATLFFTQIFPQSSIIQRSMAGLVVISLFGNLVVMTFTAARVKQEIAKEGILPWSLVFAASYRTPHGLLRQWLSGYTINDKEVERAPTAAYFLHWCSSVFLLLVTIPIQDPRQTYNALVSLYSFTIMLLLGFWVCLGLIRIKIQKEPWHWKDSRRYRPSLSPAHVIIYGATCALLLGTAFAPPDKGSPYHYSVTGFTWWIIPLVGLSTPLWGLIYSYCLLLYGKVTEQVLVVKRTPYWKRDPECSEEYIQTDEWVDCRWRDKLRGNQDYSFPSSDRQENASSDDDNFNVRHSEAFKSASQHGTVTTSDGRTFNTGFPA